MHGSTLPVSSGPGRYWIFFSLPSIVMIQPNVYGCLAVTALKIEPW